MVLLTFVWKCFQDRNFHGVVVGLYEQSIESWVGLTGSVTCVSTISLYQRGILCGTDVIFKAVNDDKEAL